MKIILGCIFIFAVSGVTAANGSTPTDRAQSLLRQAKSAAGGTAWDAIRELRACGKKTSFGLAGSFNMTEQLDTGCFERKATYAILVNAEGEDRQGRWRQDNSGGVHPLDSEEAREVAASERYLARRGYFFPDRCNAAVTLAEGPPVVDVDRLLITPQGGRACEVWLDAKTHLVTRAHLELSVGSETYRYGDYRSVHGVLLPFSISLEHGDEAESGVVRIDNYEVSDAGPDSDVTRPRSDCADTDFAPGINKTSARVYLDAETGFLIVEANVDGQGPYPFILDTGGHDILTPEMAGKLGLAMQGSGFSTGAGAGTTPTQFATVPTLALGAVTMKKQPFTILHIDLGTAGRSDSKRTRVAGILGLELFERLAVTVDYRGSVILRKPETFQPTGKAVKVPLVFTSDMPLAPGLVDGHRGQFGVDTGNNTDLILFPSWARAQGIRSSGNDRMQGTSVGGDVDLQKIHVEKFALGSVDVGSVNALLSSDTSGSLSARAEAGNLGNSILSGFSVSFDFTDGSMYLERH